MKQLPSYLTMKPVTSVQISLSLSRTNTRTTGKGACVGEGIGIGWDRVVCVAFLCFFYISHKENIENHQFTL